MTQPSLPAQVCIICDARQTARISRVRGWSLVDIVVDEIKKVKKVFARADREGIAHVGILGNDELDQGCIKIKTLDSGTETTVSLEGEDLTNFFNNH